MTERGPESNYRLKLKRGDFIEATVKGIDSDSLWLDASPWSNIESLTLGDVSGNPSVSPGSTIYAEVAEVTEKTAHLRQRRGAYTRNHLPGDSLRVQTVEQVSSKVSRGEPESLRNLDTLYVIGVPVAADVTVTIAKIRNGTAYAFPVTKHDPGLVAGREIEVSTTATTRDAVLVGIPDDHTAQDRPIEGTAVELAEPASVTGTVTARLTDETADERVATIDDDDFSLPAVGETFETTVERNRTKITCLLSDQERSVVVRLDHGCPLKGRAVIELVEREDYRYRGELRRYISPNIVPGEEYRATVLEDDNRAVVEGKTVRLKNEISKTGKATVRITEITDEINGRIIGDIDRSDFGNPNSPDMSDVDITDLSRL